MSSDQSGKKLTGIKKIHITPESGRIVSQFSKSKIKTLKKLSIDLEIPIEEVIEFAITFLSKQMEKSELDDLEGQEIIKTLLN